MPVELSDQELVTEECRIAFPALFEMKPRAAGSDKMSYQAVVLIPPDVELKPFKRAIAAAMKAKWGKVIKLPAKNNPLKDCGEKSEIEGYEEDWTFINTHSGRQPSVVDRKLNDILDPEAVFPGMWCKFHLRAYAWDHQLGGKGVSFSLESVQIVRGKPEDRIDGVSAAKDVFEAVDVDDDEDEFEDDEMFEDEEDVDDIDDLMS